MWTCNVNDVTQNNCTITIVLFLPPPCVFRETGNCTWFVERDVVNAIGIALPKLD